jgi:2-dehydropantoate 2-reductase
MTCHVIGRPVNLIVGAGAVGTILATYLKAAGQPVALLIRDKDRALLESAGELRTDAVDGPSVKAGKPELRQGFDLEGVDYFFICVKFPALAPLLDQLPATLPSRTTLVSTLNGLAGLRMIRDRFPGAKVVPMSVMYNGQLLGPLHAQITTKPIVIAGTDDQRLLHLFDGSGMIVKPSAGEAAAWGKLLVNLANALGALTHSDFQQLLSQPDLRRAFAAVLDEATSTLRQAGVHYELPMPVPEKVYRWLLVHGGPLPWLFAKARNGLKPGSYPSMVADVEQGRKTEVAQLNGEIVAVGHRHGIPTPVNRRIVELVQSIEGHLPPTYLTPAELRRELGA